MYKCKLKLRHINDYKNCQYTPPLNNDFPLYIVTPSPTTSQ